MRAGPCPVSAVEAFEEVMDSLCVSQYSKDGEERVVLFLKMASGHSFQPALVRRVQDAIRSSLSARHVPGLILETKDIPVRPPAGSVSCRLAAVTRAPSPPTSPRTQGLSSGSLLTLCMEFVLVAWQRHPFFFFCRLFFNPSSIASYSKILPNAVRGVSAWPSPRAALVGSQNDQ